jgi:phage tail protein X
MNRYQNIQLITSSLGIKYYKDSKYPRIPLSVNDIYVITTIGDRFDLLANQYYGDPSLWWIISIANESLPQDSLYLPVGTQIRIPPNPATVVSSYNQLNS